MDHAILEADRTSLNSQTFIVRIWWEGPGERDRAEAWRGSIEQVGGGQKLYFQGLESLVGFIQESVGVKSHRSRSRWFAWLDRIRYATHLGRK